MNATTDEIATAVHERKDLVITVNFNPVAIPTRHSTGLGIKEAAISQRVNIRADFQLFRDKGNGRREPVADSETGELHEGEKFEAVDGDDNS